MLLIGPTPLSGIGQSLLKYNLLFPEAKYIQVYKDPIPKGHDVALIFALPIPEWIQIIAEIKSKCKKVICMTICETETVHEVYGELFKLFDKVAVHSEFCKRVFSRQFPGTEFVIMRAHVPCRPLTTITRDFGIPKDKYIFYHIGNIIDQRKNFKKILEAFLRLNLPDSFLVVKATCNQEVQLKLPNVLVINGLLPQSELDSIHTLCDCYVSFSNSEGIGLGAVEAAVQNKPVIIPSYGGATDYIKTPYLIDCDLQEVPCDDFLFKKGMIWGKPKFDQLLNFMKDAYDKKLHFMDHSHTRFVVGPEEVYRTFALM
jgi:glycosyltransferase involved in cell wall biosynthesis